MGLRGWLTGASGSLNVTGLLPPPHPTFPPSSLRPLTPAPAQGTGCWDAPLAPHLLHLPLPITTFPVLTFVT